MRPHALHRVIASRHVGDNSIVIVRVEPSAITNLPAGFSIKGSVIKNHFARLTRLEFLRTLAALDNGEHFTIIRSRLPIAFEIGFRKLLVGRIGRLLGRALP